MANFITPGWRATFHTQELKQFFSLHYSFYIGVWKKVAHLTRFDNLCRPTPSRLKRATQRLVSPAIPHGALLTPHSNRHCTKWTFCTRKKHVFWLFPCYNLCFTAVTNPNFTIFQILCWSPCPCASWFSVHTANLMLRGSKENTKLHPKLTASMLRDHYVKELHGAQIRKGGFGAY